MFAAPGGESHLDVNMIAQYVDGTLNPERQAQAEAHLAYCADCREDVVAITRIVRRRPPWKRWSVIGPLAAAAALVLLVAQPWRPSTTEEPVLRGDPVEAADRFAALSPSQDDAVSADSAIVFSWSGSGAAASYRISVTDENGDLIWSESTTDTMISLSDNVMLESGKTYFWYVDALLLNGRSATTGVRRFTLAP